MPELSVNIPAYNAEKYIGPCLDSILVSKLDMEVLVLDDGSTDGTAEIIKQKADKDSRVRLLSFGKNLGVATGRQKLLENSNGMLIAPFDADDLMIPGWLEKAKSHLDQDSKLNAVYGKCRFMTESGEPMEKVHGSTYSRVNCFVCHPVPQGAVIAKKEFFLKCGGYIPTSQTGPSVMEDFFTWCRMMLEDQMKFIDVCAFLYRDHSDQMTKKESLFISATEFIQNFLINQNGALTQSLLNGSSAIPASDKDRKIAMFVIGILLKSVKMDLNTALNLLKLAEQIDPQDYGVQVKLYEAYKASGRDRAALGAARNLISRPGEDYYPNMMGHFLMTDFYQSKGDRESFDRHQQEYNLFFERYCELLPA